MTGRDLTVPSLLFIKAHTSGLYREELSPVDAAQPWIMQLAFILANESGAVAHCGSHIIKADGRTAKENAVKVHGISAWASTQIGIPESRLLGVLADMLKTAPVTAMKVVTYGTFDRRIISSLYQRFGERERGSPMAFSRLWESRPGTEFINLQDPWATQVCKLPADGDEGGYRWPTLDEAAETIIGRGRGDGFRDAYEDTVIVKDIYLELARRGFFGKAEAA